MPYPVTPVTRPAQLDGQSNGRLSPAVLTTYAHPQGGPLVTLCTPACRSWAAMAQAAAKDGVHLYPTSESDTYRTYNVQERIFLERYTTKWRPGPSSWWEGRRWYKKIGVAAAAVPGTSNHGWGLAVDVRLNHGVLDWLLANEHRFGFSHEIQSEGWHVRYWAGDAIPAAVKPPVPPKPKPNTPIWETDDMQYVADQGLVYLIGAGWHRRITGGTPAGARVDPVANLAIIISELEASGLSVDIGKG